MKRFFIYIFLITVFISCKQESETKVINSKKQVKKIAKVDKIVPISKEETSLLKKLINEVKENYSDTHINLNEYPYSLSVTDEAESASIIYFSIFASDDLNGDGVTDYIVSKDSDGMAGSSFVFVIMKDKINIKESHQVLTYAPFSYNVLNEPKYKDNKFKITAVKNFRTYGENSDELTNLVFLYKNNNLYEASYLSKCKLAELESKTIFNQIPNITKRKRSVDLHNYTETIEETYQSKDTIIHANFSGCDNSLFEFHAIIPANRGQIRDIAFIKNTTVSILEFLVKNTQFAEDISPVIDYYKENEINDNKEAVVDNLVFGVFADKEGYDEKKGEFSIRINIERRTNSHQTENWEITTRKQDSH